MKDSTVDKTEYWSKRNPTISLRCRGQPDSLLLEAEASCNNASGRPCMEG